MLPINMDELYEQAKYEASRDTGLDSMDNKIKEWFDCLYEESIDKLLDDTFDVRFTKYREAEKCYEDERDAMRAHNGELRRDFYSFWLYRWFDRHGDIIYVGLTRDLYRRMKEHKRDNSKINHAVRIECVEVDCEANMEFGEKYLINKFKPRFNERCKWNGQIPDIPFYDNLNWVNIQDVIIPAAKSPIKRDYIKDYMVNHSTQIVLNWKIDDMPKAFKNVLSDIINDCDQNYNISVIEA